MSGGRARWGGLAGLLAVVLIVFLGTSGVDAQSPESPWSRAAQRLPQPDGRASYIKPSRYLAVTLDQALLSNQLAAAPLLAPDADNAARAQGVIIPDPNGIDRTFLVSEVPIFEPALAARFPDHKAYTGTAADGSGATIRFEVTPFGFHAQVAEASGWWYIDPYFHLDTSLYISYFKSDLENTHTFVEQGIQPSSLVIEPPAGRANRSGTQTRFHRVAVAANDKYSTFHGGTVPSVLAAITTSINRVNGIYGPEIAVNLQLVANEDQLIYLTDSPPPGGTCPTPGTGAGPFCDPYSDFDDLDLNQTNIDNVIGFANYDIGHHYTTSCGLAGLGVVGTSRKAEGCTGLPNPVNDPFVVDYVAHEMGHQYGGNHTFNGTLSSCAGNANGSTAMEVGSGTTIMAYAGICGLDDVQKIQSLTVGGSDPYFHSVSFDEIIAYTTTPGSPGNIGSTPSGNAVPSASAGPDGSIPASTPFYLAGSGADTDAGTVLTYLWEQRDLGARRALGNPQITAGPLMRSQPPTVSPIRYFPKLSTIAAANTNVPGPCPTLTLTLGPAQACWSEFLPTAARTMTFRVTVRDNDMASGGVNTDDIVVNVVATGSPFAVTSPNGGESAAAGGTQTVTWNVSGTTAAPISAANVTIKLSTDGGLSFPTTLLTNTPNDGTQVVTLPVGTTSTTARIMVEQGGTPGATGVRFFDMSNGNFTITPAPAPDPLVVLASPCVIYANGAALGGGETRTIQVTGTLTGQGGASSCVPAGASSVIMTIVAENPVAEGNLQVSAAGVPAGGGVVNYAANQLWNSNTIAVPLSAGGAVDVTANSGGGVGPSSGVRLVAIGYHSPTAAAGLKYYPVTPCAAADSRPGQGSTGGFTGPFAPGAAYPDVKVAGTFSTAQGGGNTNCGVPTTANAVIVNVVATNPTGTASGGGLAPGAGNSEPTEALTYFRTLGMNNSAVSIMNVDAAGEVAVNITNQAGTPMVNVRLVVLGYIDDVGASGLNFRALTSCAIFDTRTGQGATGGFLGVRNGGSSTTYQIAGTAVPASQGGGHSSGCGVPVSAKAVLINLVAVNALIEGNLQAYATGTTPTGGVLNFRNLVPQMNNSNAVIVPLSSLGQLTVGVNTGTGSTAPATNIRGVILGYYES